MSRYRADHWGKAYEVNLDGEKQDVSLFSKVVIWGLLYAVGMYLLAALVVGLFVMTPIVWDWVRGLV
jgi:hypothetical protein